MGLCHSRYKTECGRRLALKLRSLLPRTLGGLAGTEHQSQSNKVDSAAPTAAATTTAVVTSGPSLVSAQYDARTNTVELRVKAGTGKGMHFMGTKACTRCCCWR